MNFPRVSKRFLGWTLAALMSASLWGASCSSSGSNCDVAAQTGCKDDLVCRDTPDGKTDCFCNPATNDGCDSGTTCEEITDGTTGCFETLVARGSVFDCADQTSTIQDARVVAMDVNGSPISTVAVTDASGNYELEVPTRRNPDGSPVGDNFTLRCDAAAFETFPSGIRQAVPVSTASPTEDSGKLVIDNPLTDICLLELEPGFGTASIFGTVTLPKNSRGALVVAEASPTAGFSAVSDRNGDYKIFNLAAGTYSTNAYVQGANYDAQSVTLAAADSKEVDFTANTQATATLNGSVQIVNPNPGTSPATSVILVVESTFNEALARGETPPGLRAPAPGIAPNITNGFTIDGIPAGKYVVLAAFENDDLVRDPDTCIAGTDILHQAFAAGDTIDLSSGFKITGALDVISPGADGPENVATTTPTLTWVDDSSEKSYRIQVFDSFGNLVGAAEIPGVSGHNPSIVYGSADWLDDTDVPNKFTDFADPLVSGTFYQFRATSIDNSGCEISQTEDLKGVFFVQ
jgi:hypothetical protein